MKKAKGEQLVSDLNNNTPSYAVWKADLLERLRQWKRLGFEKKVGVKRWLQDFEVMFPKRNKLCHEVNGNI